MIRTLTSDIRLNFRAANTPLAGPIQFTTGRCADGQVLVARSQAGLCAVFLDDNEPALVRQLREAFPQQAVERAEQALQHDLAEVARLIEQHTTEEALSLDIGGTPFQQRVWQALCDIPAGETRTYAQVAERIGAPDAVRAVASACAANLLAVAVPCHRVVRSDGEISGYRWGVERKRALLAREAA